MSQLQWSPTTEDDLDALVRLGEACLERDGGLPDLADPEHMRSAFVTDLAISGRDELGDIVAAAAVGRVGAGGLTATGLVDPAVMGRGIGRELADWMVAKDESGSVSAPVATAATRTVANATASSTIVRRRGTDASVVAGV